MKTLIAALCATLVVAGMITGGSAEPVPTLEPGAWAMAQGEKPLVLEKCRLELLKSKVIVVGAAQSGVLDFVEPAEEGKRVEAKGAVAKIKDEVIQERLKAAAKRVESDVEIKYAEKSNEVAVAKYDRALKSESYSDAELMELKLDKEKTELQIEKAKNDRVLQGLEQGEISAEIKTYTMTAPISGEVTRVMKHRGESVRQGDDIMEITDLSEIRAIGQVPTIYQSRIKQGMRVKVRLVAAEGEEKPPFDDVFEGKITHIKSSVSRVSQTLEVYATVTNVPHGPMNYKLRQGMKSQMAIMLPASAGAAAASLPRSPR